MLGSCSENVCAVVKLRKCPSQLRSTSVNIRIYLFSYFNTVQIWTRQISFKLFWAIVWTPGGIAESRWWHSDEALGTHLPDDLRDLIIGASESRESQNPLTRCQYSLRHCMTFPKIIRKCFGPLRNTYLIFNFAWHDAFRGTTLA